MALSKRWKKRWQTFSLLVGIGIIGLGIGWLAGLSLSPVVANIVVVIVAVAASVVTAVSGLEAKDAPEAVDQPSDANPTPQSKIAKALTDVGHLQVNPWPLAVLLVGMFLGTSLGIYARTNDIFGKAILTAEDLQAELDPWVKIGMDEAVVAQKLFELKLIQDNVEDAAAGSGPYIDPSIGAIALVPVANTPNKTTTSSVLFFDSREGQEICYEFYKIDSDSLEQLERWANEHEMLKDLFAALNDPVSFREVVEILCRSRVQ